MELNQKFKAYTLFKVDLVQFRKTIENGQFIRLRLEQESFDFSLYENDIRGGNYFELRTTPSGKIKEKSEESKTFSGILQNGKFVRLTTAKDFVYGAFETDSDFLIIDQLKSVLHNQNMDPGYLIMYETSSLKLNDQLVCKTETDGEASSISMNSISTSSTNNGCLILELATDADYEYYQKHGSDSNIRILGEINNLQGAFSSTFDLDVRVVYQHVWETSSDPYVTTDSDVLISEIQNTWNSEFTQVNRDLVHLFTGKSIPKANGQASGIGTICRQSTSVSFTVDRASGAFMTTAHEIGHNLGGIHRDGILCTTDNNTIMCSGPKEPPIVFSSYSITRISNYINSYSDCLYKIDAMDILGEDVICENDSRTYTLETHIQGDINWELDDSSIASIVSGQGTETVTIENSVSYPRALELTVNVSNYGPSCGIQTYTKKIHLNEPEAKLTSPGTICTNQLSMDHYMVPASSGAESYRLVSSSPDLTFMGLNEITLYSAPAYIDLMASSPGSYLIELFTVNECGTSRAAVYVTAESCSGGSPGGLSSYEVYPSISSDMVTIKDLTKSEEPLQTSNLENSKTSAELRNFQGVLLKTIDLQTKGETTLSVSSFKNGHYFIIINKGNEKEIHRVIVSHN